MCFAGPMLRPDWICTQRVYVLGRLRDPAGSARRGLERWAASHVVTH